MSYLTQKTVKNNISFNGVGLHSGHNVNVCIKPCEPDFGIVFKRVDLKSNNIIFPNFNNVINTSLNTTVENEFGVRVSTIEHLMGAFYGIGIDNAIVELDSQEVPIMDGSAKVFVQSINKVGLKFSDNPIKLIKINKEIKIQEGEKFASIEKSNVSSDIDFEIKYKNKIIKSQKSKINVFEDNLNDIFNSRTFCLYEDIEKLKKLNLGLGGSLENAIVVKDQKVLNESGLRNNLEFVNHKILDCMGDLFLSGYKIIGKIRCSQGGHKLTNDLLKKVFQNKENYSIYEINEKNVPHSLVYRQNLRSIA